MDPNAALQQLREALETYWSGTASAADAVAEHAAALDLWLSRGGFLPTAWSR